MVITSVNCLPGTIFTLQVCAQKKLAPSFWEYISSLISLWASSVLETSNNSYSESVKRDQSQLCKAYVLTYAEFIIVHEENRKQVI